MKAAVTLIEIDREVVYAHILITEGSIPGRKLFTIFDSQSTKLQGKTARYGNAGSLSKIAKLRFLHFYSL